MADSSFIKTEPKTEPDDAPAVMDEEDLFEDAGDLEFYDKNNHSNESLYLARVPRYMWEAWKTLTARMGDNDEIQIGTLRTWKEPTANGHVDKLRMLLDPNCPEHQILPREYDLDVLVSDVNNHFVFSEEDLPGFKARNKARAEAANAGIPTSLLRPKPGAGVEKPAYDRRNRFQPHYRKAIPSQSLRAQSCDVTLTRVQRKQRSTVRYGMTYASSHGILRKRRSFWGNSSTTPSIPSRGSRSSAGTRPRA